VLLPEQVIRSLAGIDRRTLIGKRDYALLLLGLSTVHRAADLSGLRLGDLAWADTEEDEQLCVTISWHIHCSKQSAMVRQEFRPSVAQPLCEWMFARLALGSLEHDFLFLTLRRG
jgi:hypothetical protein